MFVQFYSMLQYTGFLALTQQEVTNEVLNRNENSGNYILLQSVCFAWPQHLMDDT